MSLVEPEGVPGERSCTDIAHANEGAAHDTTTDQKEDSGQRYERGRQLRRPQSDARKSVHKLITGLKDFIKGTVFSTAFGGVGAALAWWVAGYPDGTWRWLMTFLGVIVAYVVISTLVKQAWSRYHRPSE
jgi:hypothetical protein